MFTEKDKEQIRLHGAELSTVEQQMINFRKGFPYADIVSAASVGDGIIRFDDRRITLFEKQFDELSKKRRIVKFVPASGAASRMFSHLFAFLKSYSSDPALLETLMQDKALQLVRPFIEGIERFAFYGQLKDRLAADGYDIDTLIKNKTWHIVIEYVLTDKGLGYASLPKALLGFHRYPDHVRTALEEHLVEAAHYTRDDSGEIRIHFTLSPEHIAPFEDLIKKVLPVYEKASGSRFLITHSIQKPSTDTIAADLENRPFREDNGSLVFRPGGHGALIGNLGDIDADIVFIKNIDNIVPDRLKEETYRYKKVTGGLLMYLQDKVNKYLARLHECSQTAEDITEVERFCRDELMIRFPGEYDSYNVMRKAGYINMLLDRPIRVCGMVKNEGEPGGGPFWVKNSTGATSLQIIESSQIDMKDAEKKNIFDAATHFNPVDLVCSLKDYKRQQFDLKDFVDPETGFISIKTHNGRQLKAQELPGLWNGAMANWITIFVEVPIITFNPVKTINDLLRPEHQQ